MEKIGGFFSGWRRAPTLASPCGRPCMFIKEKTYPNHTKLSKTQLAVIDLLHEYRRTVSQQCTDL